MGGISQSLLSGPNQTTPLGSQPTAPLQPGLDPTQRLFRSFNPNSSNPYGEVTTGRTNYAGSPGFISPEGVAVPQSNNSDDSGDLLDGMMAAAQGNNNGGSFASSGLSAALPGGVNDPNLGSEFSQVIARASDKDSVPLTADNTGPARMRPDNLGVTSGGGADGVGNLGAVGDFFGGIGDAIGVTNYAEEAAKPAAKQRAEREKSSGTSGGK
jgi:hypothetical protein